MSADLNAKLVKEAFAAAGVEYMFIGAGAAIIQGMNDTTQDVDVMPESSPENAEKVIQALTKLGFDLDEVKKSEIRRGKDFIQFKEPFEFDMVYAPDGFNSYFEASKYRKVVEGYPCLSILGIIKSKEAAGRPKDKAKLEMLREFNSFMEAFDLEGE